MTATLDAAPVGGLCGREPERRIVRDLLQRAAHGTGGVVLVQGEPGIGKSLLLGEAVRAAAGDGFSLAVAAAEPVGRAIPFLALRAALGEPFGQFTADHPKHDAPFSWVRGVQAHLEQRAASAPVLVCLDDVHWACPATLAALRFLPQALRHHPVAWLLAGSAAPWPDADCLFDVLEKDGATRITMASLADDAVAELLADGFGAPPDPGLTALAAEAAGNPSLLAELISGLRDEGGVRIAGGHAALVPGRLSRRLPRSLGRIARQRLDGLGERARHFLVTAAVLGPSFRLEDAAEMMGETPAALLPAVEEMMAAGIMTAAGNAFSFRQELLRRAVADTIPEPGRKALHRQYGHLLLGKGEPAVRAAAHLLQAVHPGDQTSLADLDTAVTQTSSSDPQAAASLALRALELTPAPDPKALPRAVMAAQALAAAGRLDEAARIARDALAKPVPPEAEARLRCALSSALCAGGQVQDAATEARTALAQPRLSPELRDLATAAHLLALTAAHDELAETVADTVLAQAGPDGQRQPDGPEQPDGRQQEDSPVVLAAMVARAVIGWDRGHVGEALDLLRDAARRAGKISPDAQHAQPLLALAAALAGLRRLGEAEAILDAASGQAAEGHPARATLAIVRARLRLAVGRLADADAAGNDGLAAAQARGARGDAAAAHGVLGLIALRRGDIAAAADHVARQAEEMPPASAYARAEAALTRARIGAARDDAAAAIGHVRHACADLMSHRGLLLGDPATAAWLTRAALAAGDTALAAGDTQLAVTDSRLAAVVVRAAETLDAENPGYPAIAAAAAHSRGLAGQDPDLVAAAGEHPDAWARASAAEDLGVLYAGRAERGHAIGHFTRAAEGYELAGAAADMARVRSRLRALGVRHRHWAPTSGRPATGWESLTATELTVSGLAAEGLNNRQIAARMYVSASTVAFYLRQIFRKLGIGSRVELARAVIEQGRSPSPGIAR